MVKVAVAGTIVGLLTGFFGVGGGFVIVPGLVLALGFTMPEAVGTSLLVIAINSAVALSMRVQGGSIDWSVIVPFMTTSLLGLRVGTRLAGTKDPAGAPTLVRLPARRRRDLHRRPLARRHLLSDRPVPRRPDGVLWLG